MNLEQEFNQFKNNLEAQLAAMQDKIIVATAPMQTNEKPNRNELKIGDWVKCILPDLSILVRNRLYKIAYISKNYIEIEGKDISFYLSRFVRATRGEVCKHLMEDAVKRGFKIGAKTESSVGSISEINKLEFIYDKNDLNPYNSSNFTRLEIDKGPCIIAHNKWGDVCPICQLTIVKDEELPITIEVDGTTYQAEFKPGKVCFGCAEIDNKTIIRAKSFLNGNISEIGRGNRAISAIMIGKGLFTLELFNKLSEKLIRP